MENIKICPSCKTEKQLDQFSKNKSRKDGYQSRCKACCAISNREYHQSERGKNASMAATRRYRQTDKYKKRAHEYNRGEKRKETLKNWNNSEKAKVVKRKYAESENGRTKIKEKNSRYPIAKKARGRVNYLVQIGQIPMATDCVCHVCGKQASSYHHHHGYSNEHWEDVIPLCEAHHKEADRPKNQLC